MLEFEKSSYGPSFATSLNNNKKKVKKNLKESKHRKYKRQLKKKTSPNSTYNYKFTVKNQTLINEIDQSKFSVFFSGAYKTDINVKVRI